MAKGEKILHPFIKDIIAFNSKWGVSPNKVIAEAGLNYDTYKRKISPERRCKLDDEDRMMIKKVYEDMFSELEALLR